MQTILEIGLLNAVLALALALVAASISLFSPRPAVRHTLWLLVLLKLVTPPMLPISVPCPAVLEAVLPPANVATNQGQPSPGEEDLVLHNSAPSSAAATMVYDWASDPQNTDQLSTPSSAVTTTLFICLLFAIWLTGAVLWFAVAGVRIYHFQRLLRYGRAAPPALQDEACQLAERLGLARCPPVWFIPGRVSPMLWAMGTKACLVVPADLLNCLQPEQRASLLVHELAHARRRDHWVRWLELVVIGFYWWLPVAWWARRRLQQAEEECCDAWVVWTLPAVAKAYAKALLQTVDFLDPRPALPPVASGIGHVHFLKRRLTMIVRQPISPCPPWPVHLAVVVLGLLFLPLAPQRLAAQGGKDEP